MKNEAAIKRSSLSHFIKPMILKSVNSCRPKKHVKSFWLTDPEVLYHSRWNYNFNNRSAIML